MTAKRTVTTEDDGTRTRTVTDTRDGITLVFTGLTSYEADRLLVELAR